jgi:hypothetical protein
MAIRMVASSPALFEHRGGGREIVALRGSLGAYQMPLPAVASSEPFAVTIPKEEYTISEKWRALVSRNVDAFFGNPFPCVNKVPRATVGLYS